MSATSELVPVASLPEPRIEPSTSIGGSIAVAPDVTAEEWDRFVASHPEATGYHAWKWRSVFERALGHRCHYLAARQGPRVVGVLPLAEVRSLLFGRALSSLPYVNYGGVLADTQDAADALLDHASKLCATRKLDYVLLRHRRQHFPRLTARTHKVTMLLPLEGEVAAMWDSLDRKVRNQIRKAEKSGLAVVSGGRDLLDGFYEVFARNMRDLGTPVYGRRLFAEILEAFPAEAKIHVVRLGQQTIAGALSYAHGGVVEVPSASSLREHRSLCPNHIMYWHIMQAAIREGRTTFDFGRSTPNDGTYAFKEQWGAAPEPLWWEYDVAPGHTLPSADRHDAKFNLFIAAWKRLPVGVATVIGPHLVRAVP